MLTEAEIKDAAKQLERAEEERTQIRQLSLQYPEMTIEDAYAIQHAWTEIKLSQGREILGRKIGLTSRAMQLAVNIEEPDYGVLFDNMFFDDGSVIPLDRFIAPRVEVELAFVLGTTLNGPSCTLLDVLRATEYVVPALEILDARVQRIDPGNGRTRTVLDTIADNAGDAGIVIGGRPVRPFDIDLRWVSALFYRDSVVEDSGVAAAVLNHPANGIAWLANKLAAYDVGLDAGQIVLAGSFTRPVDANDGTVFHADYGELGSVTCCFG